MSLLFPLLHILGETTGKTFDKLNFKIRANFRTVTIIPFCVMLLATTIFLIVTGKQFPAATLPIVLTLCAIIVLSTIQNITDTLGLSQQNLSIREPIFNFEPLLASFIAFLLFPSERNIFLLVLVFVGGLTLLWGNYEKKHLTLLTDRGTKYFLVSMIAAALLLVVYKQALLTLDAATIFFYRMLGVFIVTVVVLRLDFRKIARPNLKFGIYSGIAYFIGSLAQLYAIQTLGLLQTILIVMLQPTLKYLSCYFILKEKISYKQVASSFVLIALVVLSLTL